MSEKLKKQLRPRIINLQDELTKPDKYINQRNMKNKFEMFYIIGKEERFL
jgi:hypothetical protein